MSSLDPSKLKVSDGTLGRHPKSLFKDGLQWHSPTNLFETLGKDPWGKLCSNL